MPENYTNYSIDKYVYDFIKKSNVILCKLEPNKITILNMFLTILIGYLFYKKKSINIILILTLVRSILDILDGGIARKCNKTSKAGKYLDIINDVSFSIMLCFLTIININPKFEKYINILYFLIIFFIYGCYNSLTTNYDIFSNNIISKLVHDNLIIVTEIYIYILYSLIK
tara:strand:- start:268 stop:780 length:513 start_codon:yes stop_codon:yes gene_type:complete